MFTATAMLGLAGCMGDEAFRPAQHDPEASFGQPRDCQTCHPVHFREWQGSIMHYGAMSPVFNALELTLEQLSEGAFAADSDNPNFCVGCHSPTAAYNEELPPFSANLSVPARDHLSELSREGLSCDFCHSVSEPDLDHSPLGDGIANMSLRFAPTDTKYGPFPGAEANTYHEARPSGFLRSAEFCGSCHDVRIPVRDPITDEPFQRLENLFTEWRSGPYATDNNPYGRVVTCQDCHMSLYPQTDPGVRPRIRVAGDEDAPEREHAIHAFTAVTIPFMDDPRFPNVDTTRMDTFGYPLGQQQRREQMIGAAVTLTLEPTADAIGADATSIPIRMILENVGAGHRVPSGFSQEREVWVELRVMDDVGVIYESGVLHDRAHPETGEREPDGNLHDEDLENHHFEIDLTTFDTSYIPGPDRDRRAEGVNLGLMSFTNRFIRILADGSWEPVLNPLNADHMDNAHSLDMLTPTEVRYDVPWPERDVVGPIRVSARLRYRAFPPELLRFLAIRQPHLVSEDIVDRNTIVEMAEDTTVIDVERVGGSCGDRGQLCCADAPRCSSNLLCAGATCQLPPCGRDGEACCAGDVCTGDLTCQAGMCAPPVFVCLEDRAECASDGECCNSSCYAGLCQPDVDVQCAAHTDCASCTADPYCMSCDGTCARFDPYAVLCAWYPYEC